MKRYIHDINIALEAILSNKIKSMLTALGIIFGVASVICMLAIINGAQQEIEEQIKMVGVNNIVIEPIVQLTDGNEEESETAKNKFSPGLTLEDAEAIKTHIATVTKLSPEIHMSSFAIKSGKREKAKLIGVSTDYFDIYNLELQKGNFFNEHQTEHGLPVCVIGANIESKFFSKEEALGNYIKFGNTWLKVIGVLQKSAFSLSAYENTGVNVMNDNIFIPTKTMLMRYENRAIKNTKQSGGMMIFFGFGAISSNPNNSGDNNYNQLDKIVVQVDNTENLKSTTEIIGRMISRRHNDVKDFQVTVPELLLKQQQRTKDIFNIVLGAIASISLLVGGIGIMNIMYATVLERIKEIGIRLSIGAKKQDIAVQFLSEAILISFAGGMIGAVLGVVMAQIVSGFLDILTIVSPLSVFVAFGISVTIGVIFGYAPARKASMKDPIESLRYE